MSDVLTMLRDTQARLATRAKRARTVLESIEAELFETETAVRVLERLAGAQSVAVNDAPRASSTDSIVKLLGFGDSEGKSPRQIGALLRDDTEVASNPDYVRTTLWRLMKRGVIEGADGRYWRSETERPKNEEGPGAPTPEPSDGTGAGDGSRGAPSQQSAAGSIPVASTFVSDFADDLDDDVPF